MDLHLPAEDPPPNLEILSALSSDEDEDQPDKASPLPTLTLGSVFETFPSLKSGTIYKYVLSNSMGIVLLWIFYKKQYKLVEAQLFLAF